MNISQASFRTTSVQKAEITGLQELIIADHVVAVVACTHAINLQLCNIKRHFKSRFWQQKYCIPWSKGGIADHMQQCSMSNFWLCFWKLQLQLSYPKHICSSKPYGLDCSSSLLSHGRCSSSCIKTTHRGKTNATGHNEVMHQSNKGNLTKSITLGSGIILNYSCLFHSLQYGMVLFLCWCYLCRAVALICQELS